VVGDVGDSANDLDSQGEARRIKSPNVNERTGGLKREEEKNKAEQDFERQQRSDQTTYSAHALTPSENGERAAQGISNLISVGLSAGFRRESMQQLIVRVGSLEDKQ
jgi:hypothetical protein